MSDDFKMPPLDTQGLNSGREKALEACGSVAGNAKEVGFYLGAKLATGAEREGAAKFFEEVAQALRTDERVLYRPAQIMVNNRGEMWLCAGIEPVFLLRAK
jgi:hypothetical protein